MAKAIWFNYFKWPFPFSGSFSSYRFPGLLVHLPVLGTFVLMGLLLAPSTSWVLPFLFVYGVIGLYAGRDLAILAHHIPLITIAVFGILIFGFPRWFASMVPVLMAWKESTGGPFAPVCLLASALLIVGFVLHTRNMARLEAGGR